ncbi:tetratricopeptide repeat protein [Actinokineospora iranica]|uniref:Tetratricopeptide repeat-containing protein n=1 Tax=Actinokineospora iranica TaxID=1271860 RepID=A0A1G6Z028_9PSEU|nr:tetratricopeptide repeat protein [Actinokineospora iranica]SDD95663.1 Tetratricopeptide repeat-containing protein [Actinokineospora iranica]
MAAVAGNYLWHPDGHPLLFRAGESLGEAGQVTAAIAYYDDLHTTATTHLGPDHPDTLATRHNLAYWNARVEDHDSAP